MNTPPPSPASPKRTAAFLLSLGVIEYLMFSKSFSYFFQGDALFWMRYRFRGWGEFFTSLYTLDVANWYRPLSNRTIPALFFRWFGTEPYGYHWVVFLLFFLCTCLVFFFLRRVSSSSLAAGLGCLFFSIHSVGVFVTYDFAFAPDLLYAAFYLLSCLAYLRSPDSPRWYGAALMCFVFGLMSKEPAATFPANLLLLSLMFFGGKSWKRTLPFWGIFAAYYLYIVRYLGVGAGDYAVGFHKDLLPRAATALFWAFNFTGNRMLIPLAVATLAVYGLTLYFFPTQKRGLLLLGIAWFFVALSPALASIGYFGLYYLFLPLVGIALLMGICLETIYHGFRQWSRVAAWTITALLLLPFLITARIHALAALPAGTALGYAGNRAEQSARSLKAAHPNVPHGTRFFVINPEEPDLWRFYGLSSLMQLVYGDDSIEVLYSSLGHTVSDMDIEQGKAIVLRYEFETLHDITQAFRQNPAFYLAPREEPRVDPTRSVQIFLTPDRVAAGKGSYTLQITGAQNAEVEILYTLNDGPPATIRMRLNSRAEIKFFVSKETQRGTYRFTGFRRSSLEPWTRIDGTVEVTD